MTDFLTKANSGVMYLIAGVVIAFVMLMAAVFLFKAYREGVRIGMDKKKLNKVLTSSIVFSVVPSIGILIGVITLAGSLGIPLPWLRLSVIGALHYEVKMCIRDRLYPLYLAGGFFRRVSCGNPLLLPGYDRRLHPRPF